MPDKYKNMYFLNSFEHTIRGIYWKQKFSHYDVIFMQDPNQAAAGATPYLRMLGTVAGGYFMAKSALTASRLLEEGSGDKEFLEAKIVTARFYAENLLPQAAADAAVVMTGADSTLALADEDF